MRNRIRMWGTSIYLYCKGALTFSLPLGAKMKDECVSVLTPIFLQQQNCWLSAGSNPPSLDWEPLSRLVPIWSAPVPLGQPFAGLTKCHIWIHCRHQVTWRHEPSSNGTVWHQSSSDWRKGSRHAKSPAINLYPHWYFFFILAGFSEFWPAVASSAVIKLVTFSLNTYPCKHCVYILKNLAVFFQANH